MYPDNGLRDVKSKKFKYIAMLKANTLGQYTLMVGGSSAHTTPTCYLLVIGTTK